jgi:LysR family glycine cleavage system transcriptional activator
MREDWRMWLLAAGAKSVDPDRGPRFNSSEVVFRAAAAGQGVALGRSVLIEPYLASRELVRPFTVSLPAAYAYYVVCPNESATRTKVRHFREWIAEEAAVFVARADAGQQPVSASGAWQV